MLDPRESARVDTVGAVHAAAGHRRPREQRAAVRQPIDPGVVGDGDCRDPLARKLGTSLLGILTWS
eukprot:15167108-Alexandrium_andersonii.AAC.1